MQTKIASSIDDNFCGHALNVGIGSRYSFMTTTNVSTLSYLATSLGIIIYRGKTVAIIGTSNGYILKVNCRLCVRDFLVQVHDELLKSRSSSHNLGTISLTLLRALKPNLAL